MGRSRNRLHVNKLAEFGQFCMTHGWVAELPKALFEVLRMRHPDRQHPLIVHARMNTDNGNPLVHCTTWGESERMLNKFLTKENL